MAANNICRSKDQTYATKRFELSSSFLRNDLSHRDKEHLCKHACTTSSQCQSKVTLPFADIKFTNLEQSTVAEIAFSPTRAMTKKENAKNEHRGWNNWRSEREKCLAYSRYLCVTTRSADIIEKRPSTSSSDSVFTSPLTHAACEPFDYFRKRNLTLHKQVNIQGKVPREVYNRDMKFHKKFGTMPTMLKTHTVAPTPNQARRKTCTTNSNSLYSMDDDTSSFCDSVSSIACSSVSHVDKQEKWTNDSSELSDKITKFNAIEKWLQGLPKPVFKTSAGNL